jgi:hypothetical protein
VTAVVVAAKDASHANTLAQQLGPRARAASLEDAITGAEPATSGWAALTTSELTATSSRSSPSTRAWNRRDVRAITRWRNRAMSRPRDRDNLDTAG